MPSRNSLKEFASEQYYHVYNRGVEKRIIFQDDQDYTVFLGMLKKYLSDEKITNINNRNLFDSLANEVHLISYCLMPNHFHLLLYQIPPDGVTKLMRRVITGYVMYFNNKYQRVGGLFQGRYKASHINKDAYLHHVSRYIHLNPKEYDTWPYSSWPNYIGVKTTPWIKTKPLLELFDNDPASYQRFVNNYKETKEELSVLKWQLANNPEERSEPWDVRGQSSHDVQ